LKKAFNFQKRFLKKFLISFLISLILILSISSIFIKREFLNSYEISFKYFANIIGFEIKNLVIEKRYEEIDKFIKNIGNIYRITVINRYGYVIADSIVDIETMENHKDRPEIIEALNGRVGRAIRYSKTLKEDLFYIAVPFNIDDELFIVRISSRLKELNKIITNLIIEIGIISLICFLIGFIIFSFYSKKFEESLISIKQNLENISKGNYEKKILLRDRDFKDFSDSLDLINSKIEKLIKEVEFEKERINSILSSSGQIIFVVDSNGKITFANKKFIDLFNVENYQNKFFWEVIKDIRIINFIKDTLNKKKEEKLEFEDSKNYYLLCSSLIEKTNETIYTIFEITSIKKFEKMKKDFVRDASHELKTPLTAIKGFIETIEDEVKNRRYIEIIKRNIDRTINIINDLLTLSKIEEKKELKIEEFDFKESLSSVLKMFEKKIKEKGLKVSVNLNNFDKKIIGDQFKIEQVLINLIDNAINYTDRGEIKINFYREENNVVFEVEDSGIGIPKEHLDRIFERFYTVDKSRSRKSGGTGLGLSIVKHIVLLHNGKIEVESEVGKGSKFRIIIPQNLTEN
jgi:two-component system phosphate regulon sensor histidine kinase PhoR